MIYRFQPFELDLRVYQLRRAGQALTIQRKVFDVLRYLIEHRDRVVGKQELLESVWPGEVVSESAIHRNVSHVRQALGQDGKSGAPIETVHGRGYRFRGDVEIASDDSSEASVLLNMELPHSRSLRRNHEASLAKSSATARSAEPIRVAHELDPFVGRESTLERLRESLDRAFEGFGSMFVLSGEPGIGKTRCAELFAAEARHRGAVVWKARCAELEGAPALWPWVQILRAYAAELDPSDAARAQSLALLEELAPELGPQPSATRDRDAAPHAGAQFRLLDRLTRFLLDACPVSDRQVRVIWLDDLSRVSATAIRVLNLLGPGLSARRLMLLITEHTESNGAAGTVNELLPDGAQRIELAGLSVTEIETYLELVLRQSPPEGLATRIQRMTGGNPLFVRELVRAWTGSGSEHGGPGPSGSRPLPSVVQDVLGRRMRGLDAGARKILGLAAVVGETFELALVERASGLDGDELLVALDAALRAGLLERSGDGASYRFRHGLIRDALYDSLSAGARSALHLQVATALEGHAVDAASSRALASHFHRALPAGSPRKTREHAVLAATSYSRSGAYMEAAQLMRWALEAQEFEPELDPHERCSLLLATALNENRAGRIHDACRLLGEVIELATRHKFAEILAVAGIALRPHGVAVVPDTTARRALEAANIALPESARLLRSRVLSRLSWTPPYAYDRDKRRELSLRARELAGPGDFLSSGDALLALHCAMSAPEDLDEAEKLNEELERTCTENPVSITAFEARLCRLDTSLRLCDGADVVRQLQLMGRIASDLKIPEVSWTYQRLELQTSFYEGDLTRVEASLRSLYSSSQQYRIRFGRDYACVCESRLRRERGVGLDPKLVDDPACGRARSMLEGPAMPAVRVWVLREAAEAGRTDYARTELARLARSRFTDQPRDGVLLSILAELSLAAVALGDRESAALLAEQMRPYASHGVADGFLFSWGCAAYYVGITAQLLGLRNEAIEQLELAQELNERMRHRPALARTRLALGQIWLQDESRATQLAGVALLRNLRNETRELGLLAIAKGAENALLAAGKNPDS